MLARIDTISMSPNSGSVTFDELLDVYLDDIDADERLLLKTRFDNSRKPRITSVHSGQDHVAVDHLALLPPARPWVHSTRKGPRQTSSSVP